MGWGARGLRRAIAQRSWAAWLARAVRVRGAHVLGSGALGCGGCSVVVVRAVCPVLSSRSISVLFLGCLDLGPVDLGRLDLSRLDLSS